MLQGRRMTLTWIYFQGENQTVIVAYLFQAILRSHLKKREINKIVTLTPNQCLDMVLE